MIKFTKEEKIAVIFLVAALFAGTAVHYYKRLNPPRVHSVEIDEKGLENYRKVNINRASEYELTKIRGIGPVLAGRIITYRKEHGPFTAKEEIKNVKGIGPKTYEKIKDGILVK